MLRAVNPDSGHLGKNAVAHLLVETGYAKDSHEAKELYLSQFGRRLAFVSADDYCHYAPMTDVMKAANLGLSVLCHLYYYRLTPEQNEVLIKQFKAMGGQALEVDYGHYSDERKAELLGYCKKYELLPVASSDRHEADTPFKLGNPEWYRALHERYLSLHGELPEEVNHGTDVLHQ